MQILIRQFRITGDAQQMRAIMAAEKIVSDVIEPTVTKREQTLHYLYKQRSSVFDS